MSLRVYLLTLGTFAAGTSGYVIAGLLPTLSSALHVSITAAGQLVTAFALAYAIASPLLAAATGRWDRRSLLVVALLVIALGNGISALATDYPTLFAARVITALGAAVFTPAATVVATQLTEPANRSKAIAVVFGGLTIALLVGVPMGSLLGGIWGYQAVFALITALSLAAAAAVLLAVPSVAAPPPSTLRERFTAVADRQILTMLGVTLIGCLAAFSVYTYLAPLLADRAGITGGTLSLLLAVYGVGGVLGNIIGGRISDRFGTRTPLIAAMACCAVMTTALPFIGTGVVGAGVLLLVWAMATWSVNPPLQNRLVQLSPTAAGLVLSMNASAIYLGFAFAGPTGGLVMDLAGPAALGPVAGVLTATGLTIFTLTTRTTTPRQAVPISVA